MHCDETPASVASKGRIKAFWRLYVGKGSHEWLENDATPDGSIEVIQRVRGASSWNSAQPSVFAAGLTTRPARLRMRDDATFRAVRLWPWTWRMLGGPPCSGFADAWTPLAVGSMCHAITRCLDDQDAVQALILDAVAQTPNGSSVKTVGLAILQSSSVNEVAARTGLSHRSLQRWSATYIGLPLRTYVRLLRFQSAFADIQNSSETVAQAAAANGYADQAHMARSFRELAGKSPVLTRSDAVDPFLNEGQNRPIGEER